jgi:chorismate dehydratase
MIPGSQRGDGGNATSTIRLGAVDYLNARPLVHGLELKTRRFSLRFDVPSKCAALLHENSIDVGMIPSIEYLRGHGPYEIVKGVGIVSDGPVASVAVFTAVPMEHVCTIAADTSSRSSVGLLQILCHETFGIDPEFVPMSPDVDRMLRRCDAALLIGDTALYLDHQGHGVQKIDLGEHWTRLTGLPFVWAFWAGRPGVMTDESVAELQSARDHGVMASDAIADAYCGPEHAQLGRRYLRENISYTLGGREEAGLLRYYELAEKYELVDNLRPPTYY